MKEFIREGEWKDVLLILLAVLVVFEGAIIAVGVDVMTDLRDTAQYYHNESNLKDMYLQECKDIIYDQQLQLQEENQ